jgi:hypothetical protein
MPGGRFLHGSRALLALPFSLRAHALCHGHVPPPFRPRRPDEDRPVFTPAPQPGPVHRRCFQERMFRVRRRIYRAHRLCVWECLSGMHFCHWFNPCAATDVISVFLMRVFLFELRALDWDSESGSLAASRLGPNRTVCSDPCGAVGTV